jgi:hypothetical protein
MELIMYLALLLPLKSDCLWHLKSSTLELHLGRLKRIFASPAPRGRHRCQLGESK